MFAPQALFVERRPDDRSRLRVPWPADAVVSFGHEA